jgi:maleylacetoacetate isomerase
VLNHLTDRFKVGAEKRNEWYRHWVTEGFRAIEALLANSRETGRFCHGDTPGIADVFLVPQVVNALRFKTDLAAFPTIRRIDEACNTLGAFNRARPEAQPDVV